MNNEDMSVDKTVESRPYTLRPLCDEDMYPIIDIIGKVCPEDLKPIIKKAGEQYEKLTAGLGEDVEGEEKMQIIMQIVSDIGVDIVSDLVLAVIRNLKTVKNDVYALLSDMTGIPDDQIRKMKFGTTPKMIMDIAKDVKNQSFFEE